MRYSISYWCVSNIGNIRTINQDNFCCDGQFMEVNDKNIQFPLNGIKSSKDSSIFGIFDGMGGEECGEIAAYIAAKSASNLKIGKNAIDGLSQFCQKANMEICTYGKEHEVFSMGTTAAILAFTKEKITLCNIGDSKIFRFYDGNLEQLSKDHIVIATFGMKAPLSQNLGIPPTELMIEPYLAQGTYCDNDIYLICSDGLTDMVTQEEIIEILISKTIDEVINELLEKALENGGKDNITIILCNVKREVTGLLKWMHTMKKKIIKKK